VLVAREHSGEQLAKPDAASGAGDVVQLLLSRCTPEGLAALLSCQVDDVRSAAAVCLGLKGTVAQCRALAALLKDADSKLVQLAENSLWSIWMRAGSPYGNTVLARAVDLIRRERYEQAARVLQGLCAQEPGFAEAFDQLGIALSFLDRPDDAAQALLKSLRRNRYHFSAAAMLGHTYVQLGKLQTALRYYQHALWLHPRLDGVREIASRLEAAVGSRRVSRERQAG
jgi:tetratricopeptide (TPR) repeat protein